MKQQKAIIGLSMLSFAVLFFLLRRSRKFWQWRGSYYAHGENRHRVHQLVVEDTEIQGRGH